MLPEPGTESYGTVAGIAALARTWTLDNTFIDATLYDDGSNPDLTTVVTWVDEVSAMLNIALAKHGFVVPLSTTRGRMAARSIVNQVTADLVKYVNNQGRFFSQRFVDSGYSVWKSIRSELDLWVSEFAPGLAESGETQNASDLDAIGFRDTDEDGDHVFPIFQRKAFGNRFDNWTGE